ncbi:MAG: Glycosyl transferase family 2 [Microgenomates group bacterium GW2011_GWA1_48_10]|nr:MAG: Glycosyl transferase family 2 [Microgenomates group bacterium GW2011_GWA1_48_10]
MKTEPLVSVIVPAYNAEKFIGEAIQSALAQTYKNLEVIVGDDGSTDRTAEIVKALTRKDARVRYACQKNQGQSAARNLAIREAKGRYIAFLDADDLFLPEKLDAQVGFLEAHPDCGVSYSKIYHFFDDRKNELYYFVVDHPSGNLFGELLRKNFINPLAVLLRKELLDRYGAFEPSFRRVDEQYLWLKLSHNNVRFCYLDKPFGLYRIHRKSLSNEAAYFKETEERFLALLGKVRSWMTAEEQNKYNFEGLVQRAKRRLFVGKLMAGKNIFARALLTLYTWKRERRLKKVLP